MKRESSFVFSEEERELMLLAADLGDALRNHFEICREGCDDPNCQDRLLLARLDAWGAA